MEAEEVEEERPQRFLSLVKGDVGCPELLLLGQLEALLPELGDDGKIPGDIQLDIGLHRGHLVPLGEDLQQVEVYHENQVGKPCHRLLEGGNHGVQPGPDGP